MATGLLAQHAAAASVEFQQRVSAAICIVAVQVYSEVTTTPGHAARAAYAVQVVTNPPLSMVSMNSQGVTQPDRTVYGITRLIAAQGVDNSSTDAAIQAAVLSDWNALAGV